MNALCIFFLISIINLDSHAKDNASENEKIFNLTIEDLLKIEVTSVSKKNQLLSDSSAAIFVITNEKIMSSGSTSIPDALRMVPGLHVARIDSSKWAVSSRGLNGRFANKLLVLIDGRSVYSPSFSGVYWEVQDMMLEDIDRIEVIRGPGATLWGANAVNGVINIITKHSIDTQGGLLVAGGGDREKRFEAIRYGGELGKNTYGRIYAKEFCRDEFGSVKGDYDSNDDWCMMRTGFRIDSQIKDHISFLLHGDIYSGEINQNAITTRLSPPYQTISNDSADVSGGNINAQWNHILSAESEYSLKVYYDQWARDEFFGREERKTFNIDFQDQFMAGKKHDIIWGAEYSYTKDNFRPTDAMMFLPGNSDNELFSIFIQDQITILKDCLTLTLGAKVENNYFIDDFEIQPNARLLWVPHVNHKIWASVSRSSRTPARFEQDAILPTAVVPPFTPPRNPTPFPVKLVIEGQPDFDSESLVAYELGYRFLPSRIISVDLATFYNIYNDFRIFSYPSPSFAGTYISQPVLFKNNGDLESYGVELSSSIHLADYIKIDANYSYFKIASSTLEPQDKAQNSYSPRHQVSIHPFVQLHNNLSLNLWLRFVDKIKLYDANTFSEKTIDSYITLDVSLRWKPHNNIELAIVGQNILDDKHLEYINEKFTPSTQIKQSFYGKITWWF